MIKNNKIKIKISLIIVFIFFSDHQNLGNAITYKLNPGRLGDHLLTYCLTKTISNIYNIPMLYTLFNYSDKFTLHTYEKWYTPQKKYTLNTKSRTKIFEQVIEITNSVKKQIQKPTLYICTLKSRPPECSGFSAMYQYVKNNPIFKKHLVKMLTPIIPVEIIDLPDNVISVAVHIRKGGGYDQPLYTDYIQKKHHQKRPIYFADKIYPRRFPPEIYYIEQIKYLAHIFNDKDLFVHIFTDDQNPQIIINRFEKKLSNYPITFSYRKKGNRHDAHVLDDLFNMTRFDCLIRPASSFSKIAQLLGNHQIIIYPKQAEWINAKLVVTKIGIINNSA